MFGAEAPACACAPMQLMSMGRASMGFFHHLGLVSYCKADQSSCMILEGDTAVSSWSSIAVCCEHNSMSISLKDLCVQPCSSASTLLWCLCNLRVIAAAACNAQARPLK